jgi:hypothetical protein
VLKTNSPFAYRIFFNFEAMVSSLVAMDSCKVDALQFLKSFKGNKQINFWMDTKNGLPKGLQKWF